MKYLIILLLFLFIESFTDSYPQDYKQSKTLVPLGESSYTHLNINNISTFFYNNGISDISALGYSGFVFPKRTGKTSVFCSGFLWGGKVPGDPEPRVGGSAYRSGLQGGKIISTGVAENPNAANVRIYKVRTDVYPGGPFADLSSEVKDEGKTVEQIRAQYEKDWTDWRAVDGAPFDDKNANGFYEPTIDVPGVPGADQTIWYVANDLDPNKTVSLYGSNPVGLELQVTIWAYVSDDYLNNLFFRKYKMINKSSTPFNDVYVSMWNDVDLGDARDDFAGCDTTLNLGFTYNAQEHDNVYFPLAPPAIGYDLVKGPTVSNGKNLPMTAFYYFAGGDPNLGDPPQSGNNGSREFYCFMQGKYGISCQPFINLVTGKPTSFALSGDPLTHEGWFDGIQVPASDRRSGLASGPFQMAIGDTQEIIIAQIAALGTDRLNSLKQLKYYSVLAKDFYDSGMIRDLGNTPPSPSVEVVSTISKIKLDWGNNSSLINSIESYNQNGYKFQGYNVYQLPSDFPSRLNSKKIATFDIADGVTNIYGTIIDSVTGLPVEGIAQQGIDSGIKRIFNTDYDYFSNSHMIIGKKYYFAVSTYTYNSDPLATPNNYESISYIVEATYYENYPGAAYGDFISVTHSSGNGDADISVKVEDPTKLTGDKYEVFFTERDEIRNPDGNWVPSSIVNKLNRPDDLTGSSLLVSAIYADDITKGIELKFNLDLVSSTNAWADGIKITFPLNVNVISANEFDAGGGIVVPKIIGNVVNLGLVNGEQTQNGIFHGRENWTIFVSNFTPPVSFDWIIYDDGYTDGNINVKNAEGNTIINSIGSLTRLARYWNVNNVTKDTFVLSNQSVVGGYYQFPPRYYDYTIRYNFYDSPIADGLRISVNEAIYDGPINFFSLSLTPANSPTRLTQNSITTTLDIQNYTIFGGTSSKAIDIFGVGTNNLEELQQDYELRFTGVWDSTIINNQKVYFVKSGGQMATIFNVGTSGYSLANHPLNPNPGSNNPFLLRIPFEVWNKDTHQQVNLIFRDRVQSTDANPFYAWNIKNRMYAVIVNSPYDKNSVITLAPTDTKNTNATWVLVFYGTHYTLNDVVTITYANKVQFGVDKFTFTSPKTVIEEKLTNYKLYVNYPNPFNPGTKIRFFLPEAGLVKIEVFNILGQRVARLVNEERPSGVQDINFDGSSLASGIYIYTIEVQDKFFEAKKMLLLK